MATPTKYLGLTKPATGEPYDVNVQNDNWDKLDKMAAEAEVAIFGRDWLTPNADFDTTDPYGDQNYYIRINGVVYWSIAGRWGSEVTVGAHGDIGNRTMGVIKPQYRLSLGSGTPVITFPASTSATGRVYVGYANTAGNIGVSAVGGSTNVLKADPFSLAGSFPWGKVAS